MAALAVAGALGPKQRTVQPHSIKFDPAHILDCRGACEEPWFLLAPHACICAPSKRKKSCGGVWCLRYSATRLVGFGFGAMGGWEERWRWGLMCDDLLGEGRI